MKVTSLRWGFCTISRQVKFFFSAMEKKVIHIHTYKMLRLVQPKCLHPRSQGLLFPCKGPDFDVENLSVYTSSLVCNSTALIIRSLTWYSSRAWPEAIVESLFQNCHKGNLTVTVFLKMAITYSGLIYTSCKIFSALKKYLLHSTTCNYSCPYTNLETTWSLFFFPSTCILC